MENIKFERKTDLPLMHIKVPFGSASSTRYVSKSLLLSVSKMFQHLKKKYDGVYEVIVTPSDFEIEMERPEIIVLNIDGNTDVETIIRKLDEFGGKNNDQPEDGTAMDECKEGTGEDRISI